MLRSSEIVLIDTGYWCALFDARDSRHKEAENKSHFVDSLGIIVPWPTVYETLRTRFVKNRYCVDGFDRLLKRPNVTIVPDEKYREIAYKKTIDEARIGKRSISLCDMTIRLMLQEVDLKIRALLTFNHRDFADVCRSSKVEML